MTFKIKNHQLNNMVFIDALKELGNAPLDAKVAWNIKRMLKQFDNALNGAGKSYVAIVEKFCKKDPEGKIVNDKDEEGKDIPNTFSFADKETEEKFGDAMKDFMAEDYEIESFKLRPCEFEGAKISATNLEMLSPIIKEE